MSETFPIAPASATPIWLVGVICLLLALIFSLLAYTAYAARHSRVELSAGQLRLVGDFWGRTLPLSVIDGAKARVVDLHVAADIRPRRRSFGTALPGYASGWFRLGNGEKALVYLTRRNAVAYVPTTQGYALLLSVIEPAEFIAALRIK